MSQENPSEVPILLSGWKRLLFQLLGLLMVGLGILGALLPVLPTTPFLLAASYFFVRSSPRLHRWLLRSRWFGPMIHDWEKHRGIRRSTRRVAIALIVVTIGASLAFGKLSWPLQLMLLGLGAIGLTCVLRLKIVTEPPAAAAAADTMTTPDLSTPHLLGEPIRDRAEVG